MKQYKVPVTYTFKGYFLVRAENAAEAKDIVDSGSGLTITIGNIGTSDNNILDWNFPVHPDTKINRPLLNND